MSRVAGQTILRDAADPADPPDAWGNAPFDRSLAGEIQALVVRLAPGQKLWLSGYLAGGLAPAHEAPPAQSRPAGAPVTILYGSQSGNSEGLAKRMAQRLARQHAAHRVLDMLDCRKSDLEQAQRLLVIVSTHGDGDPPERAAPFFELLFGRKAPRLEQVQFAVLALGDTSYEHFCAAGRRIDARLEELGARRLLPRVECDVDFEAAASQWTESIATQVADASGDVQAAPAALAASPATVSQAWTRKHPFAAEVLSTHGLTARGSTKQVRHVELSLQGSGMHYEPGDALGIVPRNAAGEVDALLARLECDPAVPVRVGENQVTLRDALLLHFEIGTLTAPVVSRYAQAAQLADLQQLAGDTEALRAHLRGLDLRGLVARHPPRGLDGPAFARVLAPLAPRLYSIASSLAATPDEAHLTVGVVAFTSDGRARRGVVSGAVAELHEGQTIPVYLHRNEGFRLPRDPGAAIVMIGAGTGVAPYRGFLAEREAIGASGRNWLLFGDRSFETDFLYQSEWLDWRRRGLLTRLDVAFSRDQGAKLYVQHRLREHGARLWSWLQEGAHVYVCGDAAQMAPDVESALLEVMHRHGGLNEDAARNYLRQLQRERRYQKDVY